MFNPFRKRNKRPDPTPAWIKWLALLFIVYAIASNPGHYSGNTLPSGVETITGAAERILPSTRDSFSSETTLSGQGLPVLCGQTVRLAYTAFREDGTPADSGATKEAPLVITLGEGKAIPALERAVANMHVGGKERVTAGPDLTQGLSTEGKIRFEIELLSAEPDLSKRDAALFRVFDNRTGSGPTLACGKPVKLALVVWSMEGKKLFETKEASPFVFTLGRSEAPLGLELGIHGMRERGAARTLILPPSLSQPMRGGKSALPVALPASQAVIADVETVD